MSGASVVQSGRELGPERKIDVSLDEPRFDPGRDLIRRCGSMVVI